MREMQQLWGLKEMLANVLKQTRISEASSIMRVLAERSLIGTYLYS